MEKQKNEEDKNDRNLKWFGHYIILCVFVMEVAEIVAKILCSIANNKICKMYKYKLDNVKELVFKSGSQNSSSKTIVTYIINYNNVDNNNCNFLFISYNFSLTNLLIYFDFDPNLYKSTAR